MSIDEEYNTPRSMARRGRLGHLTTPTEGGREIPVVSPEHIVAMKLATGDPRDERDVERLLVVEPTDYERIRTLVRRYLGPAAANRLDHIGARAGVSEAARCVRESNGAG
jgi:hypothetical protein